MQTLGSITQRRGYGSNHLFFAGFFTHAVALPALAHPLLGASFLFINADQYRTYISK